MSIPYRQISYIKSVWYTLACIVGVKWEVKIHLVVNYLSWLGEPVLLLVWHTLYTSLYFSQCFNFQPLQCYTHMYTVSTTYVTVYTYLSLTSYLHIPSTWQQNVGSRLSHGRQTQWAVEHCAHVCHLVTVTVSPLLTLIFPSLHLGAQSEVIRP